MPKIVDHDERRAAIVSVYLRLVARDGFESVSTRALSDELQVATGALWHYFENFDSLLAAAVQATVWNTNERIRNSTEGLHGLAAVWATVTQLLPLDKVTRDEAHIVVGFWGRAATRAHIRTVESGWETDWVDIVRNGLTEALTASELLAGTDIDLVTRQLRTVVYAQQVTEVLGLDGEADHIRAVEDCLAGCVRR